MDFLVSDFFEMMRCDAFVTLLRRSYEKGDLLFIPTCDDKIITDKYARQMEEVLEENGFLFSNVYTYETAFSAYENVTFVLLMGGSTLYQHTLIHSSPSLVSFLRSFSGTMLGFSAGALNMGERIYPDRETVTEILDGIGRYPFALDVHYEEVNGYTYEEIDRPLCLLPDQGALVLDGTSWRTVGEVLFSFTK